MTEVVDAFFDFSLFLGRPDIAGMGNDLEDPQKIQESIIEADNAAATLRDGSQHIIDNHFFRGPVKKAEGVEQSLVQCFLFLTVGKLDIKHSAVGFDNGEGVKFSSGRPIGQAAEVSPIDLTLFSGGGFKADKGLPFYTALLPFFLQVGADNSCLAVESLFLESLENHGCFDVGGLCQEAIDHLRSEKHT